MISIEISRKIIHLFSSLIPLGYLWYVQDKFLMVVIIGLLSLFSVLDVALISVLLLMESSPIKAFPINPLKPVIKIIL